MSETPPGLPRTTPPGGQVSDRMQALLSRAVEEQVSEQRAVSLILAELRGQVAGLAETLRLTASDAAVERLGGVVSHIVADLRTSTSLLGQRIEVLSKRVEAVAGESAAPNEQAAVRLTALAGDVSAQRDAVEQMRASLEQLSAFPAAMAALQRDVAGMHDRLQPLADLRAHVADLGATADSGVGSLRPRLDALEAKIDALAQGGQADRIRDLVVDAVSARLDRLEEAAARPVIGPEVLRSTLGDLRSSLDAASGERLDGLAAALAAVENRLGQVGQRVADIGDAAGAVPALAVDMSRLGSKLAELGDLRDDLATVAEGVRGLQAERPGEAQAAVITSLRQDIAQLSAQIAASPAPNPEDVATVVSQRVADRLVEALAPRIADVVLTRVSGALVTQLGEALSPRLQADTEQIVRVATTDSERRILAHLDEAVLALAEALLRRRTGSRAAVAASPPLTGRAARKAAKAPDAVEPAPAVPPADVQEIVDRLNTVAAGDPDDAVGPDVAVAADAGAPDSAETQVQEPAAAPIADADSGRSGVTTGLAPARTPAPAAAPALAAAPEQAPTTTVDKVAKAPDAKVATEKGTDQKGTDQKAADAKGTEKVDKKAADAKALSKAAQARSAAARPATARPAKAAPARATRVQRPEDLKPAPRKAAAARKAVQPRPILDRTPDLSEDDSEPVRSTPSPAVRSSTATSRPAPTGPRTEARPSIDRPIMPPPARPQPPAAPSAQPAAPSQGKRKPWWRPGG